MHTYCEDKKTELLDKNQTLKDECEKRKQENVKTKIDQDKQQ